MTTNQRVEAAFDNGRVVVRIDPPGPAVEQAGSAGTDTGQQVIRNAISIAVGADVRRAAELLQVVQQADRVLAGHDAVTANIDRKKAAASGLFFGAALDARLLELEKERDTVEAVRVDTLGRRSDSIQELAAIRDRAVGDGVKAMARTLADRRTAAAVERQQTAARLVAAVEGLLAKMLALDAELGVLGRVNADDEVKDKLEADLPQVFAEEGLAPHTPYDWRKEREGWEAEHRRRGWDGSPTVPAWVGGSDDREDD